MSVPLKLHLKYHRIKRTVVDSLLLFCCCRRVENTPPNFLFFPSPNCREWFLLWQIFVVGRVENTLPISYSPPSPNCREWFLLWQIFVILSKKFRENLPKKCFLHGEICYSKMLLLRLLQNQKRKIFTYCMHIFIPVHETSTWSKCPKLFCRGHLHWSMPNIMGQL
jgi:hypothetical protein